MHNGSRKEGLPCIHSQLELYAETPGKNKNFNFFLVTSKL